MRRLAVTPIKAYRLFFSNKVFPRCKYYPSCSEYTINAIEKHGIFYGIAKSAWRIMRCNPLSRGGVDLP